MKTLIVFGTRPEALKMVPVIQALKNCSAEMTTKVCVTGQHRGMLDQVLDLFNISFDYDLSIMKENQNLFQTTQSILGELPVVLEKEKPDLLLVQGDTTTAFAASLSAYYLKIPVGHVEAGLRTFDKFRPFPEEMNRRLISSLADVHFAPTPLARDQLIKEGISTENIFVTGNTIIDTLFLTVEKLKKRTVKFDFYEQFDLKGKKIILVTGHRRESFGEGFERICHALRDISMRNPDVVIIYPVHLNPNVQAPVKRILGGLDRVYLMEPVDYFFLVDLMRRAYLILTDSGGIQEEGPSLGKPVLVMREVTERPEGIKAGTAKLVGTERAKIVQEIEKLLYDSGAYENMAKRANPYGDGKASKRIADFILNRFSKIEGKMMMEEFKSNES